MPANTARWPRIRAVACICARRLMGAGRSPPPGDTRRPVPIAFVRPCVRVPSRGRGDAPPWRAGGPHRRRRKAPCGACPIIPFGATTGGSAFPPSAPIDASVALAPFLPAAKARPPGRRAGYGRAPSPPVPGQAPRAERRGALPYDGSRGRGAGRIPPERPGQKRPIPTRKPCLRARRAADRTRCTAPQRPVPGAAGTGPAWHGACPAPPDTANRREDPSVWRDRLVAFSDVRAPKAARFPLDNTTPAPPGRS